MSKKIIYRWDPSWGWDNKIYYLGATSDNKTPFWLKKAYLYCDDRIEFHAPENSRLCAGSFTNNQYYGSLSYDLYRSRLETYIDQSIFVCDKSWKISAEFRPSKFFKKPNKYLSNLRYLDNLIVPFRDPTPISGANKLAVCTGGFRWGLSGNVCEVEFVNNRFSITRETILEENMRIFDEIERCTFWNEYMFFSARKKGNLQINKIQVAKLKRNGFYSYFGEVKNSENLYGPCLNANLELLYWYQGLHVISKNPNDEKLIFENNEWILKGRKYIWYSYIPKIIEKTSNQIIFFLKKKFKRFLKNNFNRGA